MQKTLTKTSTNIDKEIKFYSQKLKELVAIKKGISIEQLEKIQKARERKIKVSRFGFQTFFYHFKCIYCKGYRTKRTGTTSQIHPRSRFLCKDCQNKRRKLKDENIRCFFSLTNQEMTNIINNDKKLSKEDKKLFLEKYLIK